MEDNSNELEPVPRPAVAASTETLRVGPFPIKWVVLFLLVFQNAATTMLVQRTRRPRLDGSPLYLAGAAVLVSELFKLPACLALITRDEGSIRGMAREVQRKVFGRWKDTLRMGVPALCYGLQNILFFVALSNLSATSYQLWSQSKTLFTAFFFVRILGQVLRVRQWLALALLTAGVGLVQLAESPAAPAAAAKAAAAKAAAAKATAAAAGGGAASLASATTGVVWVGVSAVLASCMLSGFANIYLEKVIKEAECEVDDSCEAEGASQRSMSLWVRNVQLSLFSVPQAATLLLLNSASRASIMSNGLFAGFTPAVWLVTALTAAGGLLIAAVVKFADNVLKTYATAVSILVTASVTAFLTGVAPSVGFLQGMVLVISSMLLFNVGPPSNTPKQESKGKA